MDTPFTTFRPRWYRDMTPEQREEEAAAESAAGPLAGYAQPTQTKQCIVVRKDLHMDAGKLGSQTAHAAMAFLTHVSNRYLINRIDSEEEGPERWIKMRLSEAQHEWMLNSYTKPILECYSEQELRDLIAKGIEAGIDVHEIVDNGKTVFKGIPTLTCAAFGPDEVHRLNPITGHLRPYHDDDYCGEQA